MAETIQVKLTEKMPVNGALTQKEKELVAVGASIAAGCQPCTAYHFRAARAAGAGEEEIRQAVGDALCVRNSAAMIMSGLAEKHLGNGHAAEEPCCSEKPLIGELVSASAAFAVNCVTNLETHLASARRLGASERQIETALGVARAVKKVAAQKVEAAVEMAAAPAKASDGCADDCGCHAGEGQPIQAVKESTECGCSEAGSVTTVALAKASDGCTDDCGEPASALGSGPQAVPCGCQA